ncbi:MAG: hypothetical protein CME06_11825 [Gemmatimonadetes bacterium]|nr:hypothetical protein [Gemmatimonadota bacterium]
MRIPRKTKTMDGAVRRWGVLGLAVCLIWGVPQTGEGIIVAAPEEEAWNGRQKESPIQCEAVVSTAPEGNEPGRFLESWRLWYERLMGTRHAIESSAFFPLGGPARREGQAQ